jgi:hypothetical protein
MDAVRLSGERRAAIALASLGDADRAWLLERLPEPRRQRISTLLGELREMRVSFDRELLEQLSPAPKKEAHALDGASVETVLAALEGEPDWMAALLVHARGWPWREAFLERRRLGPTTSEVKPKALEAMLAAFEAKLRALPAAQSQPPTPFWRRRLAWRR